MHISKTVFQKSAVLEGTQSGTERVRRVSFKRVLLGAGTRH